MQSCPTVDDVRTTSSAMGAGHPLYMTVDDVICQGSLTDNIQTNIKVIINTNWEELLVETT